MFGSSMSDTQVTCPKLRFYYQCFSSEKGICLPTVFLWLLFVYIEAAIRLKVIHPWSAWRGLLFHIGSQYYSLDSFLTLSLCSGPCRSTSCTSTSKIFLFTWTSAGPLQRIGEILCSPFSYVQLQDSQIIFESLLTYCSMMIRPSPNVHIWWEWAVVLRFFLEFL